MQQDLVQESRRGVVDTSELARQAAGARSAILPVLKELVSQLDAGAATDGDLDFAGLVTNAQQLLQLDDLEMATLLKTSRPTIGRWKRGQASPLPLARRAILRELARKTRTRIKAIQD